jgi:hypothetical protein
MVVPVAIPVADPLRLPIVAMAVLMLVQVPPLILSIKIIVEPVHTLPGPDIIEGKGLMVTTFVAMQPVPRV